MARSPSSVGSVLRKLTRPSRSDFCSSLYNLRGSTCAQQFNEIVSVQPASHRSKDPHPATFCKISHFQLGEEEREEVLSSSGQKAFSPSQSDLVTTLRTVNFSNSTLLSETHFKVPEHRWSHLSRHASPSLMLQPAFGMSYRGFASSGGAKDDTARDGAPITPPDGSIDSFESAKDWMETAYNGVMDSAKAIGGAVHEVTPTIKGVLDDHPIILEISIPVTVLTVAWVILPRVLRRLHAYVELDSAALLGGTQEGLQAVSFEESSWKAMENPARLFATISTALQVGVLVAPNSSIAHYLPQVWSGASALCIVWFLHSWKGKTFKRLIKSENITKEQRELYLGLDKFGSFFLIGVGVMALAQATGIPVASLLTVGGVSGIATAFAAREILANLLTGLTLSFSKPFTVGDTIKAGTIEGKVQEVGIISTRLLNVEKSPITVPNAFFTSQAIINKSRAPWRSLAVKIPIHLQDFEKIPSITLEIREMLYRNEQIFLEEDKPSCHIAQFSPTALEIAISCNIKPMNKNEFLLIEQGILVEAARIITMNGATLGGA